MFYCSYFSPSPPLAAPTSSTQFKMCLLQRFRNAIERSLDSRQSTCSSVYVLHIVRSKPCSPCISVYINCPTNMAEWIVRVTGVDTCMYDGCPESIQPFWISQEPGAWFWCNLAASQRRPYCASVNSHSPVGLVSRQWDAVDWACVLGDRHIHKSPPFQRRF